MARPVRASSGPYKSIGWIEECRRKAKWTGVAFTFWIGGRTSWARVVLVRAAASSVVMVLVNMVNLA